MESADLQDAEKTRALRLDRYRLDPLRFVDWAFPWGSGLLADHKGPEKWQADVLRDWTEAGALVTPGDDPSEDAAADTAPASESMDDDPVDRTVRLVAVPDRLPPENSAAVSEIMKLLAMEPEPAPSLPAETATARVSTAPCAADSTVTVSFTTRSLSVILALRTPLMVFHATASAPA